MQQPLAHLQRASNDDWLICDNSSQFPQISEKLYLKLTQKSRQGIFPKILLAEREPVKFLASFIAACAANCPIFLANPNWVKSEWEQVLELVQPDIILGDIPEVEQRQRTKGAEEEALIQNSKISNSIMIPTGGSSGKIRFAIHTWETLMASVQGFKQHFQTKQINSFCVLPLYHVSGLMQFLRSYTTGGNLVILPFKTIEEGRGAASWQRSKGDELSKFFISLVPTQLQRLLQQSETINWLTQFHTVLLGGATAWQELLEQARHHSIRLAPTYGMTETASQIATLKPEEFLNGKNNCGQILPHAQVTICSPTGQPLATNETGIITIQATSLALGYYPNLNSFPHHLQLDDLGFLDNQGHLTIVGRNSNKIITGGENVYPAEVEAAIRATQMVKDVCVIGISDRHWGQAVTAIYIPSHPAITKTHLQTAIQHKLTKFKHPKHWLPVPTLPRNPQGKINQQQLHQLATSRLQTSS